MTPSLTLPLPIANPAVIFRVWVTRKDYEIGNNAMALIKS